MSPLRLLALLSLIMGPGALAQDEPVVLEPPERGSFDHRLFQSVYNYEEPVFSATMRGVNVASYPTFFIVVPAAGVVDFVEDGELGVASRMAIAEFATLSVVLGLKNLVRRERPYAALPDVYRRPRGEDEPPGGIDPFSFPSGHSSVAFALATTASLAYSEWYVVAPAYVWASATALARVWHGVHYPSDIAVGAVVGTGMGLLVHVLFDNDEEDGPNTDVLTTPPAFSFTIPF